MLRLRLANLRLRWPVCSRIVRSARPLSRCKFAACAMQRLLNHQLNAYGGDLAIAVMGIIWAMGMLVFMPIFGINQGAQPIIGYNYGAERFDRVKKTLETAVLAARCSPRSALSSACSFRRR